MKKLLADSMEYCCFLRHVQDLLEDGKTPDERRFGEPFKGPLIPFGAVVENYPISARSIKTSSINLARKFNQESFLDMH